MKKASAQSQNTTLLPSGTGMLPASNHRQFNNDVIINELWADSALDTANGEGVLQFSPEFNASLYGFSVSFRLWKQGKTVHCNGILVKSSGPALNSTQLLEITNDEFNAIGSQILMASTASGASCILTISGNKIKLSTPIITSQAYVFNGFWATAE